MKCPYCAFVDNKVIDSRLTKDQAGIRRRRECLECGRRWTTYERTESEMPLIVKKDGRREEFDRQKMLRGLQKACEKRPVSVSRIEKAVERIEKSLQEMGEKEIDASRLGELAMAELRELDQVAYVRFASVYRQFKDVSDFMSEIKALVGGDNS